MRFAANLDVRLTKKVGENMIFSMWGPNDSTLPDTTVGGTEQPHCANGDFLEGTERLFLVFEAPDTGTAFKFHGKVQDTGSLTIVEGDNVKAVAP